MPLFFRCRIVALGAAFLPSNISGLQLWLDANDTSTLFQDAAKTTAAGNGDVVGAWADKSGQGNDATQATTSLKPILDTVTGINSLPVVRGDITDDIMTISVGPLTDETIFVVSKHAVNNAAGNIITADANTRLLYSANVNEIIYRYNSVNRTLLVGFTEINANIITSIHDAGTSKLSVNGGAFSSGAAAGAAHTYITLFALAGGINPLHGDIAELIAYNTALSAANTTLVENYLSNKYGITLS